jgi:hypothetical protein
MQKAKRCFGICVLPNTVGAGAPKPDSFIYVYGVRGMNKELVVARVKILRLKISVNGVFGMASHGTQTCIHVQHLQIISRMK